MRAAPLLGVAVLVLAALPAPAQLKEGDSPPSMRIERFMNTRMRSFNEWKGRIVLHLYLKLDDTTSRAAVEKVHMLLKQYGRKGFAAVIIAKEDPRDLQSFADATNLRIPIAIEKDLKSYDRYGFESFPTAVMIDPFGKITWIGEPRSLTIDDIERKLRMVKSPVPFGEKIKATLTLPKTYAAIVADAGAGKLGAALLALREAEKAPGVSEEDVALITDAKKVLEDIFEFEWAYAERTQEIKRFSEAQRALERIGEQFEGLEQAAEAKAKAAEMAQDPRAVAELEAAARIEDAQRLAETKKVKEAIKILEELIAGPLRDTKAAKRAPDILEELKKKKR